LDETGSAIYAGIGRAVSGSSNNLEVEGTASKTSAGSWAANSDARIKRDIRTITGGLELIKQLNQKFKMEKSKFWLSPAATSLIFHFEILILHLAIAKQKRSNCARPYP